jgi:hypothetical protein
MFLYVLAGIAIMMLCLNRSDVVYTNEEKLWVVLLMGVFWPVGVCIAIALSIYNILVED